MNIRGTLRRNAALLMGAVAAVGFSTVGIAGTASAGGSPVSSSIEITYRLPDVGQSAADALTPELFLGGNDVSASGMCMEGNATPVSGGFQKVLGCDAFAGEQYVIGVDVLPADHYVEFVSCIVPNPNEAIDHPNAVVTPTAFTTTRCDVFIRPFPLLYVDKVLTGGGALTSGDFALEVYDDAGALVDGAITDPSDATCSLNDLDDTKCAAVPLVPGDYALGEVLPDYGYDLASASCVTQQLGEQFPAGIGEFSHGSNFGAPTLCTITNDYVTQTVTADLVLVNDNGGTATGADFTIEVFDNGGNVVASGPDPEPGTGNASAEFVLPIGDYTFGVDGPDGYTASATVTPVDTGTATEIIETGAEFTTTADQTAAGVITVDDQVAPTTTTTTTTTQPAATTTTTIAATLPETGSNSQLPMMLIALAFLGLGGAAILTTRRA